VRVLSLRRANAGSIAGSPPRALGLVGIGSDGTHDVLLN